MASYYIGVQQRLLHFWAIRFFRVYLPPTRLFYPWPKTLPEIGKVSISKNRLQNGWPKAIVFGQVGLHLARFD